MSIIRLKAGQSNVVGSVQIDEASHEEFYQNLGERALELLYARDKHFRGGWERVYAYVCGTNPRSFLQLADPDEDRNLISRIREYEELNGITLRHKDLRRLSKPLQSPNEINDVVDYGVLEEILNRDHSVPKSETLSRLGVKEYRMDIKYKAKPRGKSFKQAESIGLDAFPLEVDCYFLIPIIFNYAAVFTLNGDVEPFKGQAAAYWLTHNQCEIALWEYLKIFQREKAQLLWDAMKDDYLLSLKYGQMSHEERASSGLLGISRLSKSNDERIRRFEELKDASLGQVRFSDIKLFDRHSCNHKLTTRISNLAGKVRAVLVEAGLISEEGFDKTYDHRYVTLTDQVMMR